MSVASLGHDIVLQVLRVGFVVCNGYFVVPEDNIGVEWTKLQHMFNMLYLNTYEYYDVSTTYQYAVEYVVLDWP